MTVIGYAITESIFVEAEKRHPDLMEPWSSRLADCADKAERQTMMRAGLAATFRARFPMPAGVKWWDEVEAEKAAARSEAEAVA